MLERIITGHSKAATNTPVRYSLTRLLDVRATNVDPTADNLAHLIYPSGVSQEDWAHDLPNLVGEVWSSR